MPTITVHRDRIGSVGITPKVAHGGAVTVHTDPVRIRTARPGAKTRPTSRGMTEHPATEIPCVRCNAARRRAAIEELYTEDCVLYVPPGVFVGPEALDKFAGDLRATHPNFVYTRMARPRPSTIPGVSLGGRGRSASRPTTQGWM